MCKDTREMKEKLSNFKSKVQNEMVAPTRGSESWLHKLVFAEGTQFDYDRIMHNIRANKTFKERVIPGETIAERDLRQRQVIELEFSYGYNKTAWVHSWTRRFGKRTKTYTPCLNEQQSHRAHMAAPLFRN
jgi:phage baseplate assembly protein gpV